MTRRAIRSLAASSSIDGLMTVGMLMAFMAYKGQFLGRMTALLDQVIQFSLLSVQLARVSDIALAERERNLLSHSNHDYELQGHIEMRDVSFRYAARDRDIVRKLDGDYCNVVGLPLSRVVEALREQA